MSQSRRIRLNEMRRIQELLEEISNIGVDPTAWRHHMLEGLCHLTHARVGISTDVQQALPEKLMQMIEPAAVGFGYGELPKFAEFLASDERLVDPGALAMIEYHQHHRFYTHRREEMVDSKIWYASPVVSEGRRSVNIDHYLVSSISLNRPGWWTGFALYRNWGEKPFDERDQRLVRLFHASLLRRLQIGSRQDGSGKLPVYLRQMLRSLLQGHDSRESADALGLSPNTIKSYTKELYARLGVNSRGGLFARFSNQKTRSPIYLPAAFDSGY